MKRDSTLLLLSVRPQYIRSTWTCPKAKASHLYDNEEQRYAIQPSFSSHGRCRRINSQHPFPGGGTPKPIQLSVASEHHGEQCQAQTNRRELRKQWHLRKQQG